MKTYEIPLTNLPKAFSVALSGRVYDMRVYFANVLDPCFMLDIASEQGEAMVNGIPLLPGDNLLAQYEYLDMGGELRVVSEGDDKDAVPQWGAFPAMAHLVWVDTRTAD